MLPAANPPPGPPPGLDTASPAALPAPRLAGPRQRGARDRVTAGLAQSRRRRAAGAGYPASLLAGARWPSAPDSRPGAPVTQCPTPPQLHSRATVTTYPGDGAATSGMGALAASAALGSAPLSARAHSFLGSRRGPACPTCPCPDGAGWRCGRRQRKAGRETVAG